MIAKDFRFAEKTLYIAVWIDVIRGHPGGFVQESGQCYYRQLQHLSHR
jgi:hypothetical protein